MSRADKTGRSKAVGRHSRIYHWFYDSQAWRSLCAGSRGVYLMLLRRYSGPGTNNGSIPLSVREVADEFHVGKSTAHQFLTELQERGFIEVMVRGTFRLKNRKSTEWRLTEYGCDVTGELPTKTFMRWEPGKNLTVRPEVPTVPDTEPIGTCTRTVPLRKASHGT